MKGFVLKQITMIMIFLSTAYLYADIEKGKAVYAANCAICHTVNGGGAMGPDFNMVSYTRTKEDIRQYAKDPDSLYKKFGYSANAMPTLPLEETELQDVADYISSLQPFKKWMIKKKS